MPLLSVEGLTVDFGGLRAVNNLHFEVEEGEIFSLIGPNGAGKTTTFNAITGFITPSAGSVSFEGHNLVGHKPHRIAQEGIIRTFQKTSIFPSLTVYDNVVTGFHCRCRSNIIDTLLCRGLVRQENEFCKDTGWEVLEFVGLSGRADIRASELSYGEQRQLEVAIALAGGPKLMLLDEPVCGLNPVEANQVMELIHDIRDRGITIVLVEHNMKLVMDISDRVLALNYGKKIAEGSPESVSSDEQVIKAYLGEQYFANSLARKPGTRQVEDAESAAADPAQ
jgi:branched-chain amino acid transport system ATP-binding protein